MPKGKVYEWLKERKARRNKPYSIPTSLIRSEIRSMHAGANTNENTSALAYTCNIGTLYSYQLGKDIAKGTNQGNRTGSSVYYRGLDVRMAVTNNLASQAHNIRMRIMLLRNKRAATSNLTDMFHPLSDTNDPQSYDTSTISKPAQLIKQINKNKFEVFYDKVYYLPINRDSNAVPKTQLIKFFVKVNRKFTFNQEADAENRILPDMNVLFFIEGDHGIGPLTDPVNVNYATFREFFYDK